MEKKTPFSTRRKLGKQNLLVRLPGVVGVAKDAKTISDSWYCLCDDKLLKQIVTYTNQYIGFISEKYSRNRDANKTDITEIKAFIGLLYLAGVYRNCRLNLEDLWGSNCDGIETFKLTMSLSRFRFIMRCIRFDDRETRVDRKKLDRLCPVREIFEQFVENCKKCYSLGANVVVDEKLEAFRGKCLFRQYLPSKPAKYGIKIFALVDSRIFYTSNLEIYAGVQPQGPFAKSNKTVDIVKRLTAPIVNTGRNITADNWFSDVTLLKDLADTKLSFVGTLKKNKWQIPSELKNITRRDEGSSVFAFRKEGTMVSYVPKKKRNVILISSLHFNGSIDEESGNYKKPEIITFYNKTKGGVDTVDKLCATYNVARSTRRWPNVIFFSMLNVMGINAQIIFTGNGGVIKNRRIFLRQLAKDLVQEQMIRRASNNKLPKNLHTRLSEIKDHHIESSSTPKNFESIDNHRKRKLCEPCQKDKQRKNTKYCCKICGKYLCLGHVIITCSNCYDQTSSQQNVNVENEDSP